METVLITGATGLIGHPLCDKLKALGYRVTTLSRTKNKPSGFQTYVWNIEEQIIDQEAIDTADYIIHLAGANIGEKRWTKERKQFIVDSRVKSAQLLFNKTKSSGIRPKAIISASAIGFYGAITSDKIFDETHPPAVDFLGTTCQQWESSITQFETLGIRTVLLRTGIVLAKNGGALAKMAIPIKLFLGSPIGSGKQYMPWIHIDDLCNIYIKAITDNKMQGVYNAVAPDYQTNTGFTKTLSGILNRPCWPVAVPAIVLKTIFGEMSAMLLNGSRVSSKKITTAGFTFKFSDLKNALSDIFKKA